MSRLEIADGGRRPGSAAGCDREEFDPVSAGSRKSGRGREREAVPPRSGATRLPARVSHLADVKASDRVVLQVLRAGTRMRPAPTAAPALGTPTLWPRASRPVPTHPRGTPATTAPTGREPVRMVNGSNATVDAGSYIGAGVETKRERRPGCADPQGACAAAGSRRTRHRRTPCRRPEWFDGCRWAATHVDHQPLCASP